jgi:hypothetical protein
LQNTITDHHHLGDVGKIKELLMEDLLWLGFIVGLLALTLVYVRLCDNA